MAYVVVVVVVVVVVGASCVSYSVRNHSSDCYWSFLECLRIIAVLNESYISNASFRAVYECDHR